MRFWVLVLLWVGGDPFQEGVEAYRAKRYQDALAGFSKAIEESPAAPPAYHYNKALAALAAGRHAVADFAAQQAGREGSFLRGNIALARSLRAEAEAGLMDPDPTALDRALQQAMLAEEFWVKAATSGTDWPAARRNAERAALRIVELKKKKAEAEKNRRAKKAREPEPEPGDRPREEVPAPPPLPQWKPLDLAGEGMNRLLDRLASKEKEKRKMRSETRKVKTSPVEKDW